MKYFLLLFLFSACAPQSKDPSMSPGISHKPIQSVWTTQGASPFNRIILAGDRFDAQSNAQVITNEGDDGCDSTVYLHGDDNSGATIVTTSEINCLQYNGQEVTYERINDLTMQFCIGSACASYQ